MSKFRDDETFIKPQTSKEVLLVRELVARGYDVSYGRLVITDLSKTYHGYQADRPKFQVYCNDIRIANKDTNEFNEIYFSIGQAADKFVALKKRLETLDGRTTSEDVPVMPIVV